MSSEPVRVACLGLGWWSDVLADAAGRTSEIDIVACFTRSEENRAAFAKKYDCRAAASYQEILADDSVRAIFNTTPNSAHLETVRLAAESGKHVFLDKPIANTVADGKTITELCAAAGVILSIGYHAAARATSAGSRTKSPPDGSVSWCRRSAISVATGSERSTSARGAISPPGCRAASCCRSASISPMYWRC